MSLHLHLRELVARQGPTVVESAESFRGALDDFLTEDEATTGELNLLVDAVRLGAVHRMVSMIDHGAEPAAAVREAGAAFARDRGTDDVARCRWAVAVVGHALGRVDEAVVLASGVPGFSATAPPPSPEPPPAAVPPPPPRTPPPASRPAAPSTEVPAGTTPETETEAAGSVPAPLAGRPTGAPSPPPGSTPDRPPRRRTGRTVLIGLLVAAVVAAAVLVGVWLGSRDDDPDLAADSPSASPTGDETGGEDTGGDSGDGGPGGIPDDSVVLPVTDGNGDSRIYSIDVDSGASEALTEGADDRLPTISPDRSTVIYLESSDVDAPRPIVLDVVTGRTRRLFRSELSPCEYSARPAFNPAGDRLVVPCVDEFGTYTGAWVVKLNGELVKGIPLGGVPMGTPTWTSLSTVVFARAGNPDTEPSTLWEAEVGGIEPTQLTDGSQGWDSHPDWSPEARLLLFSRHQDERFFGDILTRDVTGEPGPATDGEDWAHPAWSPDGSRVVFTVRDDNGTEQLAVAPIDDLTAVDYVPDLPGDPGVPAWGSR